MVLEELGFKIKTSTKELKINDNLTLYVKDYLPIKDKISMIEFIAYSAVDSTSGTFSPIRVELYFGLALCKWYAGMTLDEENAANMYDILETNGILREIISAIPQDEYNFVSELVEETIKDMSRYNSSAAGIIQNMNIDASNLDTELNKILNDIQSKKGLETLSELKEVVNKEIMG